MKNEIISNLKFEISKNIERLFDEMGVPKKERYARLSEITGVNTSSISRKLTSDTGWSLEQIAQISSYFGESVLDILGNNFVEATFHPGKALACRVKIGRELSSDEVSKLVAWSENGHWHVGSADDAEGDQLFKACAVQISGAETKKRIAVVDDDENISANIVEYLEGCGFTAVAFNKPKSVFPMIDRNVFDGFIIDWLFDGETSKKLIEEIRMKQGQDVPILLLTGTLETGMISETELSDLAQKWKLSPFEKPTRLPLLMTHLQSALQKKSIV